MSQLDDIRESLQMSKPGHSRKDQRGENPMGDGSTIINKSVAQYLFAGSLNLLAISAGDDGCCTVCCGVCAALAESLRNGDMDRILRGSEVAQGSDWWDNELDQVNRDWLHSAWTTGECTSHDQENSEDHDV